MRSYSLEDKAGSSAAAAGSNASAYEARAAAAIDTMAPAATKPWTIISISVMVAALAIVIMSMITVVQLGDVAGRIDATKSDPVSFPYRYWTENVPGRTFQESRGTCWDFATIGVLEHQYRQQGIAKGFLKDSEFVQFSEQAYAAVMVDACQQNHDLCVFPRDFVAWNSTQGGEITLLAYLAKYLSDKIYPVSICPYTAGDETTCPGLTDERRRTNPLKFTMRSFDNAYTVSDIKRLLLKTKHAIGFTAPSYDTYSYVPCVGDYLTTLDECKPKKDGACQTYCPAQLHVPNVPGQCCAKVTENYWTMEGEFWMHHGMRYTDGHVMLLVGYNDAFEATTGEVGGLILRNTWHDLAPRGRSSHSLAYLTNQIPIYSERAICPNSHNPLSWYQCSDTGNSSDCLAPRTYEMANASYSPLELRCRVNQTFCEEGDIWYAYTSKLTFDRLTEMCFVQKKNITADPKCTDPMSLAHIATIFDPVVVYPNDDTNCGFYFWPYSLVDAVSSKFGWTFATDISVDWDDQSYAANAGSHGDKAYDLVRSSTREQRVWTFDGPYPDKQTGL